MQDTLHEKCAVFGTFETGQEAARTTFYGLWALQHRGQESSGIVSSDGEFFIDIQVRVWLLACTARKT